MRQNFLASIIVLWCQAVFRSPEANRHASRVLRVFRYSPMLFPLQSTLPLGLPLTHRRYNCFCSASPRFIGLLGHPDASYCFMLRISEVTHSRAVKLIPSSLSTHLVKRSLARQNGLGASLVDYRASEQYGSWGSITTPCRHFSMVHTVHSSVSEAAERQREKEVKEDMLLEDEEFSQDGTNRGGLPEEEDDDSGHDDVWDGSRRSRTSFSLWPSNWIPSLARSLSTYANALEKERSRIGWVLYERRQLVGGLHGSSMVGTPTNMKAVLQKVVPVAPGESSLHSNASSTPSPSHHTSELSQKAPPPLSPHSASPVVLLLQSPYLRWRGSSFTPVQLWKKIRGFFTRQSQQREKEYPFSGHVNDAGNPSSNAVATITEDLDYLRTHRDLHQLPYYRRLQLTPKRNIWHAMFHTVWNVYVSVMNAFWCVLSYPFRLPLRSSSSSSTASHSTESKEESPLISDAPSVRILPSFFMGLLKGILVGAEFLVYGCVLSPILLLTTGTMNSMYGILNFLTGKYMFDALSGRYMKCTVLDTQLLRSFLQREKRLIRAIGRMEFRRRKLKSEDKWTKRMESMGFSMENLQEQILKRKEKQAGGKESYGMGKGHLGAPKTKKVFNPYDVLHVKRTAPLSAIKAQYKKLAMVFHPDVAQSSRRESGGPLTDEERRQTQEKFEEITRAYQILSNRDKRRAYDRSGESGLAMHESKYGEFLQRTPEEVVQRLFGGEAFRYLLVGELLRSHWALRYEAQVSVSLHDLEELQCIRVRQIASELAWMADVHAMAGEASSTTSGRPSSSTSITSSSHRLSSSSPVIRTSFPSAPSSPMSAFRYSSKKKKTETSSLHAFSSVPSSPSSSLPPCAFLPFASHIPSLEPGSNPHCDFSQKFMDRCDAFILRLLDACFGRELLHEVGLAYVSGSQRFLGLTPFYAPKMLVTKKIFSGIDRIWYAFKDKASTSKEDPSAMETVARKVMVEYFHMEYDNVVADLHVCLRFAVQMVLQDVTVSERVRQRRCYAVWYIGQKMLEKGVPFGTARKDDDDTEMMAYIQQAANSSATVAKPKPF